MENSTFSTFERQIPKLLKERRYEDALALSISAIQEYPTYLQFHLYRCEALYKLGRRREMFGYIRTNIEGIETFTRYKEDPSYVYAALSEMFENLEEIYYAFDYIKKAIELQPNKASYYWSASKLRREIMIPGNHKEALLMIDKAIELDPAGLHYYKRKVMILMDLGRYEDAIICIAKKTKIEARHRVNEADRPFPRRMEREKAEEYLKEEPVNTDMENLLKRLENEVGIKRKAEEEIARKEAEITRRETEVKRKEAEIWIKEEVEIKGKEAEIARREAEIETKSFSKFGPFKWRKR